MKVKECMCNNVCCVKPETNIKEVAKLRNIKKNEVYAAYHKKDE